ncbi:dihydropteroate synthase [Acidaminococcus massiliensis]|jgi:dihydropteroate synthase|uniref:dihydropteroate synthase n=1 Tax=Acidaminococcus massiliensis TaxID=1852375 RepID=UPI0023F27C87|nr:dihydropteroate synthase [Acidaminococcus massiliensis]
MFLTIPAERIRTEMEKLEVHPAGIGLMVPKAAVLPLKLLSIRTPAANIIKQEMLSLGGDCVNPKGTINCSLDRVDVILLGNRRQYQALKQKLKTMAGWFGIQGVLDDLQAFLEPGEMVTCLADGRKLTYEKMRVMGILNVTPDSFYAGSRISGEEALLQKAESMLREGADLLDIGGESTRPGADPVTPEEEKRRVTGALAALRKAFPESILSVDTYHADTAEVALEAGADIINDVTAATGDGRMLETAARAKAPLVLMHMRGTPKTMMTEDMRTYQNVVGEVSQYLLERAAACAEAGLGNDKMILDPGLGFAKGRAENLDLCSGLAEMTGHGIPVLLAGSRKAFIGKVLGDLPAEERLEGTMALSAAALYAGAQMVRVHDVKENVRLIRMLEAIRACR